MMGDRAEAGNHNAGPRLRIIKAVTADASILQGEMASKAKWPPRRNGLRRLDPGRLLSAGVGLGAGCVFQQRTRGAFDLDPLVVVLERTSVRRCGGGDVPRGLDRPALFDLMDGFDGRDHALAKAGDWRNGWWSLTREHDGS